MTSEYSKKQRELASKTVEQLNLIASLLSAYELGNSAFYIPIAAHLRILLCDTLRKKDNSLFGRLMPKLTIGAFRSIEFDKSFPLAVATAPYRIFTTSSGVILADFELSDPPRLIPLSEWREQVVTHLPCKLTPHDIIRSVCDKGGGAHVDDDEGVELRAMRRSGPTDGGIHIPFIIAAARYSLNVGHALIKHNERHWGVDGLKFDPPFNRPVKFENEYSCVMIRNELPNSPL